MCNIQCLSSSSDKDIIYINQHVNVNRSLQIDEEKSVHQGAFEAKIKNKIGQPGKPSLMSLFESIDCLVQLANQIRLGGVLKTWRLIHIDFFIESTLQKSITHIKLPNRPIKVNNQSKNNLNG